MILSQNKTHPTFPFHCYKKEHVDIIRKSNGKVRIYGNFYNNGDSSFDGANVILGVIDVEEI